MKKKTGFTLLELVIVVAMVAIVVSFAIPAMTTFTKNDRLTTNINILVGHLSYARSEAVKRSRQVNICTSSNGTLTYAPAATAPPVAVGVGTTVG